jgi:hypothetical protein
MKTAKSLVVAAILVIPTTYSNAALVAYTDEAAFLSDLAALGSAVHEGFEGSAWDGVRSSISGGFITAPSVSSLGVTWTSNNPTGGVTTSGGPALTGAWGFYALPHGSYDLGNTACTKEIGETPNPDYVVGACGDGFLGSADSGVLYGVGGWIDTNTPFAKLGMFIGEYNPDDLSNQVDFGESGCDVNGENCTIDNAIIGTTSQFFGVIDSGGFSQFEYREMEGTNNDQKKIFADDFYFAGSDIAAIPVPPAAWLFGTGLLGLIGIARRKKGV